MKRLLSVFAVLFISVITSLSACAEQDTNLMRAYDKAAWEGDTVYYEDSYGTLSFRGESGTAAVTFPVEDALGVWFYFDMGNLSGKGTGSAVLEFLDKDETVILAYETEKNNGNGSFNRYEIGSDEGYAQIPENTCFIRVVIRYEEGKQSPYFRNFSLVLSKTHSVDTTIDGWDVSGKLEIVQVGVTKTEHIIWIVFVILTALIMLGARKLTERAKKIRR